MTYIELSERVAALGYVEEMENKSNLLEATNLALGELYLMRPVLKTVRFAVRGQKPVLYVKERACAPGELVEYTLNGRAYSMRLHGICQFMVKYGEDFKVIAVNTGPVAQLFKGIVAPGTTISIWGDSYNFSIFDFSVYEKAYTDDEKDVHDGGPTITYDLRKLYGDFLSFVCPARDAYGSEIEGCRLYDGKLELDATYNGELVLTYRRLPTLCDGGLDKEVDLPDEYKAVFPLLVASYAWLDTEDSKAKHYRSLFEKSLSTMASSCYQGVSPDYKITDGWA